MVTLVDLAMNAWMHELYKVWACSYRSSSPTVCRSRAEAFAAKEPVLPSLLDGIFMGVGFALALTVIGAVREVTGSGTLFADASLLLGPAFKFMELRVLPENMGVLMMVLPPGGFSLPACWWSPSAIDVRAGRHTDGRCPCVG
jgi:electron transport complex protein RnfE